MKVNLYATLRLQVNAKSVELPLADGSTVQQVLNALIAAYPALRGEVLDGEGHLLQYVHVFINGRDVHFLPDQLQTALYSSDLIDLFPPVGGGAFH